MRFATTEQLMAWIFTHGLRIAFIVAVTLVTRSILHAVSRRMERFVHQNHPTRDPESEKRARTLGRILRSTVTSLLFIIAAMMVLREIGVDIGPLIAGAGVAGLAIGFGAQGLVKDVITGFFLLLEDQVRVGDVIQAGGVSGLVESMNLRTIVLRDLDGRVHVIPNGEIKVVSNLTKGWSRSIVDVNIRAEEDVDPAVRVLREVGESLRKDPEFAGAIVEPVDIHAVEAFGDAVVQLRVLAKTTPLEQWRVGRELRRRIKQAFDEQKIKSPISHPVLEPENPPPSDGGDRPAERRAPR